LASEPRGEQRLANQRKRIFRIYFSSQGKSYEIYARKVTQGELYGFVEIEDLLFGERSSLVVDPAEEALRKEFAGVRRLMIPFHAVARIEEVEKEGAGKVLVLPGGTEPNAPAAPQPRPPVK